MKHIHTNPSPSHEVRAWCNGAGYDAPEHLRGCGQSVSLSSFADGPHESYLKDVRIGWVRSQILRETLVLALLARPDAAGFTANEAYAFADDVLRRAESQSTVAQTSNP